MGTLLRTRLGVNSAGQALFRLITILGPTAHQTATLLEAHEFDITRAALALGLANSCEDCAGGPRYKLRRGCHRCVAALRQRVHRIHDAVERMLGPAAPRTRHRRPVVMFGADRAAIEGDSTLYDRAAAEEPEGVEL